MGSADAVARETAWLTSVDDGLPALAAVAGGPFDVIVPYFPRTPQTTCRSLFVLRKTLTAKRFAAIRSMNQHLFLLRIWWPAADGDGVAENDQAGLDEAVDLVLARVGGFLGDKTHGGRFLSVAENGADTEVTFVDPMRTLPEIGALLADITYPADDVETIG